MKSTHLNLRHIIPTRLIRAGFSHRFDLDRLLIGSHTLTVQYWLPNCSVESEVQLPAAWEDSSRAKFEWKSSDILLLEKIQGSSSILYDQS